MKPYILLTTSRKPSPRTRSFVKELSMTLPCVHRVNRGKKTLLELGLEALRKNIRYIIVVGERKGNPSLLRIYSVGYSIEYRRVLKHIASIVLSGVRLSRESPSSTRVFNPETIFLDINECISDQCLLFADMMYKIFNRVLHEKPDVEVKLCDLDTCFKIEFRNRIGRQCGPVIKVTKVVVYEGMD